MKFSVSVITICFNNLEELIATCKSVDKQSRKPEEHLIVDGSSDEKILRWLQDQPQPTYRRWIHERDKGISDAFNKGITNAIGDVNHLLNSGDVYYDTDAIKMVMDVFNADPSIMWTHSAYVQNRGGS